MKQRANIKFCVKLEKKFAETYELMKKVYGDDCIIRTQVYTWFTRFKNGRENFNDDLHSMEALRMSNIRHSTYGRSNGENPTSEEAVRMLIISIRTARERAAGSPVTFWGSL